MSLRILLCQPTLEYSGSEKSLLQLLKMMAALSWGPVSLLAGCDGPIRNEVAAHVASLHLVSAPKLRRKVRSVPGFLLSFATVFRTLRRLKREQGVDLVYVNTLMFPQALVGAFLNGIPCVVHLREVRTTYSRVGYAAYLGLAGLLARAIVPVCRHVAMQSGMPPRLASQLDRNVVYNTSDADVPFLERVPGDEIRILMAIPITVRKGGGEIPGFAAELRRLLPPGKGFRLDVVGRLTEGDLFRKLSGELQSLGLSEQVRFHGSQESMSSYYREAHVVVHPSHTEALSRVLVEAVNYSLPCVATSVGGSGEVVVPSKNGFLVPVGDCSGMARHVAELACDPVLYARFSREAYRLYKEKFSAESQTPRLERIVRECMGHGLHAH